MKSKQTLIVHTTKLYKLFVIQVSCTQMFLQNENHGKVITFTSSKVVDKSRVYTLQLNATYCGCEWQSISCNKAITDPVKLSTIKSNS